MPEEEILSGRQWPVAVKKRDDYTCVNCGSTEDVEAHHKIPRCHGGKNVLSNGETLCHSCHWEKHRGTGTHGRQYPDDYEKMEHILLTLPKEMAQEIRTMAKEGERPLQYQLRYMIRIGLEAIAARKRQA